MGVGSTIRVTVSDSSFFLVRTPDRIIEVDVKPYMTLGELKEAIAAKCGCHPSDVTLKGHEDTSDSTALRNTGLSPGDAIDASTPKGCRCEEGGGQSNAEYTAPGGPVSLGPGLPGTNYGHDYNGDGDIGGGDYGGGGDGGGGDGD